MSQAIDRIEERIDKETKEYLRSQGNIGLKMDELAADARITQGKTEENNQAVAEVGTRLDGSVQQLSRLSERIEKLEGGLNSAKGANIKASDELSGLAKRAEGFDASLAALKAERSTTIQQISQLVGALKAVEAEINALKKVQADAAKEIEAVKQRDEEAKKAPVASPEKPGPSPNTGAAEVKAPSLEATASAKGSPGSRTPEPAPVPTLSPDQIYQAAYADYNKGNFDLAIEGFSSYVSSLPQGSQAPNAQYWLGECYYSQREFQKAIDEFDKVIKDYPKGARVPSALLKKAYAYLELKDKAKARPILEVVVKRYPQTREAGLAKDKLRQVK
jgi:tol-pal system protein YbgF